MAIASTAVAAVAYVVWEPVDSALGRTIPAQTVSLRPRCSPRTAVYLLACRLLRVRELDALRGLIARRAD